MPLDLFLLYLLTNGAAVVLGALAMFLLCLTVMVAIHLIPRLWDVDEEQ